MMFQDIAGLQPRADGTIELWPVDMGYDHFTVNNLSYHGTDLTIVWQKPGGTTFYPAAPMGYSLYVDGHRAFTADSLAHVTAPAVVPAASQVSLSGNPRLADSFLKAGVALNPAQANSPDLAEGKTATASFTTTTPASQATSPANAVDGFTISGLPVVSGPYVGTNPIWGNRGSPNAQDWLQVDLGSPARFNEVKVYFYSNKAFGSGGSTYREPAAYTVQYYNGSSWVDIPGQVPSPQIPAPNYNQVTFAPVLAQQVRILVTPMAGFAVGIKEIQVFNYPGRPL
jgi:hypothetical protein